MAATRKGDPWESVALELVERLAEEPSEGRIWNALQHMWGYVREQSQQQSEVGEDALIARDAKGLLVEISRWAKGEEYLWHSTALSDLAPFV